MILCISRYSCHLYGFAINFWASSPSIVGPSFGTCTGLVGCLVGQSVCPWVRPLLLLLSACLEGQQRNHPWLQNKTGVMVEVQAAALEEDVEKEEEEEGE